MSEFDKNEKGDDELVPTGPLRRLMSESIAEEDIPNLSFHQSVRMTPPLPSTMSPPRPTAEVKKKPDEPKQPSDFLFGKCLGEGAYARVVHAKLKKNGNQFAIKIMEKMHIKKENKVLKFTIR